LQVVTYKQITVKDTLPGVYSSTNTVIEYLYFDSNQKFPVLTVSYQNFIEPSASFRTVKIKLTNNVFTNINTNILNQEGCILFPNPANNILTMNFYGSSHIPELIDVINSHGQIVKSFLFTKENYPIFSFSVTELERDFYQIVVHSRDRLNTYKVIVK